MREPGAPGALPLASKKHESLVEVSESTVTLLKLTATACLSALCAASGAIGASVVMTAIIVAILGMIMPEPFTMPPIVTRMPSNPKAPLS